MSAVLRDPTAEVASELRVRRSTLDTLAGKTVALMDIGKMRGDEFIDALEATYVARGIAVRRFKKPTNTRVAPRQLLVDIADAADAVVVALSD